MRTDHECVTHIGDYCSIALNDVRTVVTLQHNIQIHEDSLILVFITRPPHLLQGKTHTKETRSHKHY